MRLRFFDTAEVIEFADSVAIEYCKLRRSAEVRLEKATKRLQRLEKLSQKVESYCRDRQLNFYKKAKMINAIKQGLETRNIAHSDIAEFLNSLIVNGLQKKK